MQVHSIQRLEYRIRSYVFLRDIIFAAFTGNLSLTKIKSSKFFKTIAMHMELKG